GVRRAVLHVTTGFRIKSRVVVPDQVDRFESDWTGQMPFELRLERFPLVIRKEGPASPVRMQVPCPGNATDPLRAGDIGGLAGRQFQNKGLDAVAPVRVAAKLVELPTESTPASDNAYDHDRDQQAANGVGSGFHHGLTSSGTAFSCRRHDSY